MINFLIVKQLVKDTREMGVDEHEWKVLTSSWNFSDLVDSAVISFVITACRTSPPGRYVHLLSNNKET